MQFPAVRVDIVGPVGEALRRVLALLGAELTGTPEFRECAATIVREVEGSSPSEAFQSIIAARCESARPQAGHLVVLCLPGIAAPLQGPGSVRNCAHWLHSTTVLPGMPLLADILRSVAATVPCAVPATGPLRWGGPCPRTCGATSPDAVLDAWERIRRPVSHDLGSGDSTPISPLRARALLEPGSMWSQTLVRFEWFLEPSLRAHTRVPLALLNADVAEARRRLSQEPPCAEASATLGRIRQLVLADLDSSLRLWAAIRAAGGPDPFHDLGTAIQHLGRTKAALESVAIQLRSDTSLTPAQVALLRDVMTETGRLGDLAFERRRSLSSVDARRLQPLVALTERIIEICRQWNPNLPPRNRDEVLLRLELLLDLVRDGAALVDLVAA